MRPAIPKTPKKIVYKKCAREFPKSTEKRHATPQKMTAILVKNICNPVKRNERDLDTTPLAIDGMCGVEINACAKLLYMGICQNQAVITPFHATKVSRTYVGDVLESIIQYMGDVMGVACTGAPKTAVSTDGTSFIIRLEDGYAKCISKYYKTFIHPKRVNAPDTRHSPSYIVFSVGSGPDGTIITLSPSDEVSSLSPSVLPYVVSTIRW